MREKTNILDGLVEQTPLSYQAHKAEHIACYSVYHALDPMQMVYHDEAQWYQDRESHYRHVANVEASVEEKPLAQVFALTNHTDCNWSTNAVVVWHDTAMPLRSTSVGDIVTCKSTNQAWMVMPYGFKAL